MIKMISFGFLNYFTRLTDEELSEKIQNLNNLNKSHLNAYRKLKKNQELQILTKIIHKSSVSQLEFQDLHILLYCTIRILAKYLNAHFQSKHKKFENEHSKYQLARGNYQKLVYILAARNPAKTVEIIIDIIHDQNLWIFKRICVDLITELHELGIDNSKICHVICDQIENPENFKDTDTKLIAKVLYKLLEVYKWSENDETIIFLKRLLNLYYKSLLGTSDDNNYISNLRSCLELCCRYLIRNISNSYRLIVIECMSSWSVKNNVDDDFILSYGSTLEYAACLHEGTNLVNTFTSEIFTLVMQMIGSNIRSVSLLGNRVFQYLVDKNKNLTIFNTPKIFFEGMQVDLKLIDFQKEDVEFVFKYREIMHENFLKSFINHKNTRLNLETTYCTVCLFLIAVPSGFTAAVISCLMMNLQEIIMKEQGKNDETSTYHIHALIISVLSFICWIHKAKIFYAYIYKIVMERAQWAPHLNPPLKSQYNFAVHHVLWNKPELFLVDWEVRFGLWKRFRLDETGASKAFKKVRIDGTENAAI